MTVKLAVRGFTLVELLVVVSLLMILAVAALPNFGEAQTRSKVSATKNNMRNVAIKLEMHHVDLNRSLWSGKWRWILLYRILYWLNPTPDEAIQEPLFLQNYAKLYGPHQDLFEMEALKRNRLQDSEWLGLRDGNSYFCNGFGFFQPRMMDRATTCCDWQGEDKRTWELLTDLAGEWVLYSCGPDLTVESPNYFKTCLSEGEYRKFDEGYTDQKLFIEYDPTNGTISYGNIFRSQRNPGGLGTHPYFYASP